MTEEQDQVKFKDRPGDAPQMTRELLGNKMHKEHMTQEQGAAEFTGQMPWGHRGCWKVIYYFAWMTQDLESTQEYSGFCADDTGLVRCTI